jgi:DNA-binding GntR family transcriptional regulator
LWLYHLYYFGEDMSNHITPKQLKLKKIKPYKPGGPTISQQLAEQLRTVLSTGAFNAGDVMPSTRVIEEHYSISRKNAVKAYGILVSEGLLETVPSSATVVAGKNKKKKR